MTKDLSSLDQDTLKHRLNDIPPHIVPHIKMGFDLLSRTEPEKRSAFFKKILDAAVSREALNAKDAAEMIGLNDNVIGDVLSAVTLCIGSVLDLSVSRDDFLEAAKSTIAPDGDIGIADEIVSLVIAERDTLRSAMDSAYLANAILPSFRNLSCEIDIRLKFSDNGDFEKSIPLAVMYISTDTDEMLWLQASPEDLKRMIEQLQKTLKNFEKAATFSSGMAA